MPPPRSSNKLKLWPEHHSQRRATQSIFGPVSAGIGGKTAAAAEGPWTDPHPAVQGLSQSSPSRISQTDQALEQCIGRSIADCDGRGNEQVNVYPPLGWQACNPSNAAAYAGGLGTEALQPCPYAGSFAGTKLL